MTFDRLFVPGRAVLARTLLLAISVPLVVAAHRRAAPPQPRGGRPALAGERTRSPGSEPTKLSASIDSTDALFAENVEQKMSNPLAHFLAARSFLDRLTKLIRRRKIPDFSRRFESDQPPVIGFEPRCVGACPPCAVAGQRRLGQRPTQPGREDHSPGTTGRCWCKWRQSGCV